MSIDNITAVASSVTAIVAVYIAVRTERRARLVAATQLLLTLSSQFFEIFWRLGDPAKPTANEEQRLARAAYWQNGYLEWFLTNRFARKDFGLIWDKYFESANLSGYAHEGLREELYKLAANKNEGFGFYAQEYIKRWRTWRDIGKYGRDRGELGADDRAALRISRRQWREERAAVRNPLLTLLCLGSVDEPAS